MSPDRVGDISPTQPFAPMQPPPRFHMGTPERARSVPAARTALRSSSGPRGQRKKVRICDEGDGFEDPGDRRAAFIDSDSGAEPPPPRKN